MKSYHEQRLAQGDEHGGSAKDELAAASAFLSRCEAELVLVSIIAPAPRFRWPLATEIGLDVDEFSAPECFAIARVLHFGHHHGRALCFAVAQKLLAAENLWDPTNNQPFVENS